MGQLLWGIVDLALLVTDTVLAWLLIRVISLRRELWNESPPRRVDRVHLHLVR